MPQELDAIVHGFRQVVRESYHTFWPKYDELKAKVMLQVQRAEQVKQQRQQAAAVPPVPQQQQPSVSE